MTVATGSRTSSTTGSIARPGAISTAEIKARIAAMFGDAAPEEPDVPGTRPRTPR
ncbi:hypothetical protein [Rhodococcus phenolicus]|uniref:hypothetical protein n=1 Tax=Rhodococcus phenolicus TaxID=263849 RepID=UPI000A6FFCC8|nr:hypothetical protein [Rhodococcus phenolicus]